MPVFKSLRKSIARTAVPVLIASLLAGCITTEEEEQLGPSGLDPAAFGRADEDDDGGLSRQEFARHMHREALAEFDLDDNQRISSEEWAVTRQDPQADGELFKRLDKNGDGEVEEAEAVEFITAHAGFQEAFRALDRDGDDGLQWEEYAVGEPGTLSFTLFSDGEPGSDPE
ncbi:MAG: hypothetical protein WD342_03340 [Verrucomicrobiales bacterium]